MESGTPLENRRQQSRMAMLHLRAQVNAVIRQFFAERAVLEVETPILSAAGNTEPAIASFCTHFTGPQHGQSRLCWLRTSPEYPLKRLLAQGVGDCYELGRVFRNGEAGRDHNPEFTLLEWYRVGWDHHRLADEVAQLLTTLFALVNRSVTVQSRTYRDLFWATLKIDPHTAADQTLQSALPIMLDGATSLPRDACLDLLLSQRILPTLAEGTLTVIHDWPASQCALARIRPGDPPVAERFEVYWGRHEFANGYHELVDGREQEQRFLQDLARRRAQGLPCPPIDTHLLSAMPSLPPCAGVAIGVDRVLMGLAQTQAIAEVLAFDFSHS